MVGPVKRLVDLVLPYCLIFLIASKRGCCVVKILTPPRGGHYDLRTVDFQGSAIISAIIKQPNIADHVGLITLFPMGSNPTYSLWGAMSPPPA